MKNVLIVEDSNAIRSMIQIPFEASGRFFAAEAGNGSVALKTLSASRFNLIIIIDINSLKRISFVKSNSSHTMQAVVK